MLAETRPAFSVATDPWIAVRVARLPKYFDAFGILSPSIVAKRNCLAVDMTVSLSDPERR
jgi:hypothetical protein